jgi:hypothetical protein
VTLDEEYTHFFTAKHTKKRPLGRTKFRWEIILKWILNKYMVKL